MVGEEAAGAVSAAADAAASATDPAETLRFAQALIAAPSENPGGTEDAAVEVAGRILEDLGATVDVIRSDAGRPSVVARLGTGRRPRLAWNGHLDTVPAGDLATWSTGPSTAPRSTGVSWAAAPAT